MCIIIYKPKGKIIPKESLAASWKNNPHGGGFMYVKEGHIRIVKTVESFALWYEMYEKANPFKHDMVIHFRIGSSGPRNLVNCHPFSVNSNLAFCHNGIMPFDVSKDSPISDTVIFGRDVLQHLPAGFQHNKAILYLISVYIGHGKIVMLDKKGNVVIINEDYGHWLNGSWYSNYSYGWRKTEETRYFGMPLNSRDSGVLPGMEEDEEDEEGDSKPWISDNLNRKD